MTSPPTPERGPATPFTQTPIPTAAAGAANGRGPGGRTADGAGSASGSRRSAVVRPRRVWGGLVLALLGFAVACVGLVSSAWLLAAGGVVVVVVGGCVSWAGGIMHDATTGLHLRDELRAVRDGTAHPGVAAGAQTGSTEAHAEAARQTRVTQQVLDQAHQARATAWTRPAGWTLLLIAAVLLVSQWELVAHTVTGRTNSYRDTAVTTVLALAGLRLAFAPGRHHIAAGLTALAGLGLVLNGLLAGHDHTGLTVLEVTAGAVALVCAVAATVSPASGRRSR